MVAEMSDCIRSEATPRKEDGRPKESRQFVYRLVWESVNGPLAEGLVIHHECRNPWCINAAHLVAMTQSAHASMHLAERNSARGSERTHCANGHPLSGSNLAIVQSARDGAYRRCKTCLADAKRRYRQSRKDSKAGW